MHDDQHGTAVVLLAALTNALKVVGKRMDDVRIVVNGLGAAGTACCRILLAAGASHLVGCDREGIVLVGRQRNFAPAAPTFRRVSDATSRAGPSTTPYAAPMCLSAFP